MTSERISNNGSYEKVDSSSLCLLALMDVPAKEIFVSPSHQVIWLENMSTSHIFLEVLWSLSFAICFVIRLEWKIV